MDQGVTEGVGKYPSAGRDGGRKGREKNPL